MSGAGVVPTRAAVADRLRAAGCVFAEDEAALLHAETTSAEGLAAMVERRAAGEPLEHVVGWAEFCGLRIAVDPGVFVPRGRTALLARLAVASARPGGVVVDLCCGSGAIGAVVAAAVADVEVHAADLDPAATACARRNLRPARVHQGDLFAALPPELRGRIDVLVANVPYVPTAAMGSLPTEARDHEPRLALDGGPDGVDVLRRVAARAPAWLAPGGVLLSEVSARQAPSAVAVLRRSGLDAEVVTDEDLEATAVVGTRGANPSG